MKLVVFGLTVSSSWGNGHATLWRGLIAALGRLGCETVFFERDQPWYAEHRDLTQPAGGRLVLYREWADVADQAAREVRAAGAAMVTSYCPDAQAAARLAQHEGRTSVFYDMDTPITLARLGAGERVDYVPEGGFGGFDLVLSYAGGPALDGLRTLGASRVAPLYGHVDPAVHAPVARSGPRADLSYIGTYAADRQSALETLFVAPAARLPDRRFALAGSGYPQDFPWSDNIWFLRHLPPADHAAFYAASRLTLNVTRGEMARVGWTPSGRLFEAAACGTPVLSDRWPGLEAFFTPGEEILTASTTEDAMAAIALSDAELSRVGQAARARVLSAHTSDHRAAELLTLLEAPRRPVAAERMAVG